MTARDGDADGMSIAISWVSVVVAVVALVVAVRAERHTKRQADAAEADLAQQKLEHRQALADKERDYHLALAPTLVASIQERLEQDVVLWVELVPGQVDLDSLEVEVVDTFEGAPVEFGLYQDGVDPGQSRPRLRAVSAGGLRRGQRTCWQVELPGEGRSPRVRLRVAARAGERRWVVFTEAEVPGEGPNIW